MACYGCEAWLLKTDEQTKLLSIEMDYLRRSARVSRLQKKPKHRNSEQNASRTTILERIQRIQLKWYGNLLRMEDSRWPKKIYQWTPHGRR
jgi:hypothetical protein